MAEKVVLTMTPDTARMIETACEFYARAMWGQYEHVINTVAHGIPYKRIPDPGEVGVSDEHDKAFHDWLMQRDAANGKAREARAALFPELRPNASYGVGHYRPADIAVQVWDVLRYTLAWREHPEGGHTVDFNKPMRWADEPLPTCEIVEVEG